MTVYKCKNCGEMMYLPPGVEEPDWHFECGADPRVEKQLEDYGGRLFSVKPSADIDRLADMDGERDSWGPKEAYEVREAIFQVHRCRSSKRPYLLFVDNQHDECDVDCFFDYAMLESDFLQLFEERFPPRISEPAPERVPVGSHDDEVFKQHIKSLSGKPLKSGRAITESSFDQMLKRLYSDEFRAHDPDIQIEHMPIHDGYVIMVNGTKVAITAEEFTKCSSSKSSMVQLMKNALGKAYIENRHPDHHNKVVVHADTWNGDIHEFKSGDFSYSIVRQADRDGWECRWSDSRRDDKGCFPITGRDYHHLQLDTLLKLEEHCINMLKQTLGPCGAFYE